MIQLQHAARKHNVTSYDVAEHVRVSQSAVLWAAGADSALGIARFAVFNGAAAAWLADAVQSGATGCEIMLADASDDASRRT